MRTLSAAARRPKAGGDSGVLDRFEQKYVKTPGGCWRWVAGMFRSVGYGKFSWEGSHTGAHRAAYRLYIGPIPDGFVIDHLCRNRWCVNPLHLEAVTQRTNVLRGVGSAALNAQKTHCKRGHEFNEANTRPHSRGGRECRACDRIKKREARAQ